MPSGEGRAEVAVGVQRNGQKGKRLGRSQGAALGRCCQKRCFQGAAEQARLQVRSQRGCGRWDSGCVEA